MLSDCGIIHCMSTRKPVVAIVGRPNVGKSTFVNRLIGNRKSIVDDLPGVTRDRIYFDVEWLHRNFTVIDTGGIIPGDEDDMRKINSKDAKFDTDLAALESERNAIKTEMETLKSVAKDNVDRTYKLFS